MDTTAQFTYSRVRFDQNTDAHLVLTLKAPKLDWEKKRQPICVVPVIDISGSMQGDKIAYAKQSVLKLIDNLQTGDYCGVVAFGNYAYEIAPVAPITPERKEDLKAKVNRLNPHESTNFSEGMLMALSKVKGADLPASVVRRVIMFTDGQANRGIVGRDPLLSALEANMGDVTVSCFGYGEGADQDLLADMSTKGKGNYAFIKSPEDALSAFAKELGGLLSTYATNIVLELAANGDHKFTDVLSDVDSESSVDNRIKITLPELLSEEERNVVIAVRLAEQKTPGPRAVNAVSAEVSYDTMGDDSVKVTKTADVKAKVQFVKTGEEQTKPDEALDLIVSTAKLVQAQLEAETHAKRGDFHAAQGVWTGLVDYLAQHNHANHIGVANSFKSKYAGAAAYSSASVFLKSAQKGLTRSVGYYSSDAESNAVIGSSGFLRFSSNAAQEKMAQTFTGTAAGASKLDPSRDAQGSEPNFNGGVRVTVDVQPAASKLSKQKSKRW